MGLSFSAVERSGADITRAEGSNEDGEGAMLLLLPMCVRAKHIRHRLSDLFNNNFFTKKFSCLAVFFTITLISF